MKKIVAKMLWVMLMLSPMQAAEIGFTNSGKFIHTILQRKIKNFDNLTIEVNATNNTSKFDVYKSRANLVDEGESFEGSIYPPYGWKIVNVDGGGKTWQRFVGNTNIPAHSGAKGAIHTFGQNGYNEEGLLITPALVIETEAAENKLTFWDTSEWPSSLSNHAVVISTTDNLPSSFTELAGNLIANEIPAWREKSIDLSAYKGKTIYLALKYSGVFTDNWFVDDVKVTGAHISTPADINHPYAATPTGISTPVGETMTIKTVVSDVTGIASVVGKYKLAGQNTWTEFVMTASKDVSCIYTGTIPAQAVPVNGLVKFITTDTVNPANTGDSPETTIAWITEPDNKWLEWGTEYDTNSAIGGLSAPWWAGVDFDFGTKTKWRLTKVKLAVDKPISAPWKIRSVSQIDVNNIRLGEIITSGTIVCDGVNDLVPTISEVGDTSKVLTGHVAIVFDMQTGIGITRDVEGTSAHTYINVEDNGTLAVLPSEYSFFTGSWYAGICVSSKTTGIEDVQILPGKSELSQNYPNPFNPVTSINFYNNMSGNVKLTVMNAKGEMVSTLINSKLAAGNHAVDFNGSTLNSGIYFYKLETSTATLVKKMLLVK